MAKDEIEQGGKTYRQDPLTLRWEPERDTLGVPIVETDLWGRPIIETDWLGNEIIETDSEGNPIIDDD